ncbi:unnamed protein product, partial [Amoebophrya sp. A25]|eukprot:GSA25T00018352001.1
MMSFSLHKKMNLIHHLTTMGSLPGFLLTLFFLGQKIETTLMVHGLRLQSSGGSITPATASSGVLQEDLADLQNDINEAVVLGVYPTTCSLTADANEQKEDQDVGAPDDSSISISSMAENYKEDGQNVGGGAPRPPAAAVPESTSVRILKMNGESFTVGCHDDINGGMTKVLHLKERIEQIKNIDRKLQRLVLDSRELLDDESLAVALGRGKDDGPTTGGGGSSTSSSTLVPRTSPGERGVVTIQLIVGQPMALQAVEGLKRLRKEIRFRGLPSIDGSDPLSPYNRSWKAVMAHVATLREFFQRE